MTLHLYSMGGVDTIAADNLKHALKTWCEFTSEEAEDYEDDLTRIPDKDILKIRYEFEMIYDLRNSFPLNASFEFDIYFGTAVLLVVATAKEWAEVQTDPIILSSTEW